MEIIEARLEHTLAMADAQHRAYQKIAEYHSPGAYETPMQILDRIWDDDWNCYIGLDYRYDVVAGVSCLLGDEMVYACRWFSLGKDWEGIDLFEDVASRLKQEGIKKIFAKSVNIAGRLRMYKYRGFRSPNRAELVELGDLIEGRISHIPEVITIVLDLD